MAKKLVSLATTVLIAGLLLVTFAVIIPRLAFNIIYEYLVPIAPALSAAVWLATLWLSVDIMGRIADFLKKRSS